MGITSMVIMVKYGAQEARNSADMVISILTVLNVLLSVDVAVLLTFGLDVWLSTLGTCGCPVAAAMVR